MMESIETVIEEILDNMEEPVDPVAYLEAILADPPEDVRRLLNALQAAEADLSSARAEFKALADLIAGLEEGLTASTRQIKEGAAELKAAYEAEALGCESSSRTSKMASNLEALRKGVVREEEKIAVFRQALLKREASLSKLAATSRNCYRRFFYAIVTREAARIRRTVRPQIRLLFALCVAGEIAYGDPWRAPLTLWEGAYDPEISRLGDTVRASLASKLLS